MTLFEKGPLVAKVWGLMKNNDLMQRKWCGFCGVHEATSLKPEDQDEPFLITFLEASNGDGIPLGSEDIPKEIAVVAGPSPKPVTYGSKDPAASKGLPGSDWGIMKGTGPVMKGSDVNSFGKGPEFAAMSFGGSRGGMGKKGGAHDIGKVFVGGLPRSATEHSVHAMMSQFGTIGKVEVKYGDDGTCKGFAFVTYSDPEIAPRAIAASHAGVTVLDGKRAIVQDVGAKSSKGEKGDAPPTKGSFGAPAKGGYGDSFNKGSSWDAWKGKGDGGKGKGEDDWWGAKRPRTDDGWGGAGGGGWGKGGGKSYW